ncbi:hypothetical protein QGP82_30845 [Leptothoe sp. LEGE 181152]|nr:hypothetical protein [Leptothoe sp. LEGE 181152]
MPLTYAQIVLTPGQVLGFFLSACASRPTKRLQGLLVPKGQVCYAGFPQASVPIVGISVWRAVSLGDTQILHLAMKRQPALDSKSQG